MLSHKHDDHQQVSNMQSTDQPVFRHATPWSCARMLARGGTCSYGNKFENRALKGRRG